MISLNATLASYRVVPPKHTSVPLVEMVLTPRYERELEELMHETGSLFEAVFICTELDLLGVDGDRLHPRFRVAIDTVNVRPPKDSLAPSLRVRLVCRLDSESYRLAPRTGQKVVVTMELLRRLEQSRAERAAAESAPDKEDSPAKDSAKTEKPEVDKVKRIDWRAEIEAILAPKDEQPTDPPDEPKDGAI